MATVEFSIALSESAMELDCKITLGKNEKKTGLTIAKDGQAFHHYDNDQIGDIKFTSIPGVTLVKQHGGCNVTILNYNPDSMGIYEIQLLYINKSGKPAVAKKLFKTSMNYQKCQAEWVNSTTGNLPKGAFVAALTDNLDKLYPCRSMDYHNMGYYDSERGCVYTTSGTFKTINDFQVLTGSGFSWAKMKGFEDKPSNALFVGADHTAQICIGRCNNHGTGHIGKITNGFYYDNQGTETQDCADDHDVLICNK